MNDIWKAIIWQQFGAAIDMLENAILACPEELWSDRTKRPEFWYVAYHTLFWLDLYLSDSLEAFAPPAPFTTLQELDPAGVLPERPYAKHELQTYLELSRRKCQNAIHEVTDEKLARRCEFKWIDVTVGELLLYNMRHVQHHAAQLNLILRQKTGSAPRWVGKTRKEFNPQ